VKLIRFALFSSLSIAFFASASMAQAQRTFVSGLGNDGNPCSRTAPCRTFAQAISQTNSSGEVYVLDSAGYASFTVTKSISIVAPPGVAAGISIFSGGNGININASASDTIVLRGLTLNSQGGENGILFNTGGTLHIENCVISGVLSGAAVNVLGPGTIEVKDSIMRGMGYGIVLQPIPGPAVATIDQVRLEGNGTGDGLLALDGTKVVVRNSLASLNVFGFEVEGTNAPAELNIENCLAINNSGAGILLGTSNPTTTVRISNSTVTNNGTGLRNDAGTPMFLSRGNNTVEGNGTNTSGPIGSYSAK
jgi:hypothetical protein